MKEDIIFKYFPEFDGRQKELFSALSPLYADWNSKINVISRKDMDELYVHHVLHSLAVYRFIKENGLAASSIIDIGTGGGFPGIPLAIAMPEVSFTLCDSIAKKIKVVTAVTEALELKNVTPLRSRSETVQEKFDFVTSRGVAELKEFIRLTGHLYKKGIICLKGGDTAEEIADCIRERKMSPDMFSSKNISDWFDEDFFAEKRVIFIKKFVF